MKRGSLVTTVVPALSRDDENFAEDDALKTARC